VKTFLIAIIGLLVGFAAGFFLRGWLPLENYQQAFEADLTEGRLFMMTLQKLDSGDIAKTRSIATIPVFEDLDSLRYYTTKGWASPTQEQRQQWKTLARETLDYMLQHKDEWNPRLLTTRNGVRGLTSILSETDDVQRLSELTNYLASVEQKMGTSKGP
jgi:hypothetical protein